MPRLYALCLIVVGALGTAWGVSAAEIELPNDSVCRDWRFTLGDPQDAEGVAFDDSAWDEVRTPHDWAIAGPVDPKADGATGKLPWRGVGWYRSRLKLDTPPESRVYLDFDGVMAFPRIYVNGHLAGSWDYGYTSFRIDATPWLNRQGENVIAVRVDTTQHGSRWYPGAGIYRKVVVRVRKPLHLAHWGTAVTVAELSDASATLQIDAEIDNHGNSESGDVTLQVLDPAGKEVATVSQPTKFAPGQSRITQQLVLPNPQRWDIDSPKLYQLVCSVSSNGERVDSESTPFGIRECSFTGDDGFHLNGRRVQLYGVNLHHDHGPLGAAFYVRAMERQLQIMKEMGVNAIRTSHNAPAPELLDLCDQMGLLVWDECFDKWNATAGRVNNQPPHREHAERHLRSLVLRDRNHPSVVVWSIGNEIPADDQGVTHDRVKTYAEIVRKHDPTRQVGMGSCFPEQVATGVYEGLDLVGWNYGRKYMKYRNRYPDRPNVYSESASALSTRGFYELPLPTSKTDYSASRQVDSYDLNAAPWSDIADSEFRLMEKDRFVAGEFVWTGFDYLGEPTPFDKDARSSYFGIVDLCGIPKDRYWLYRSYWRPEVNTVHILPHWNWEGRAARAPVFVYTNGDSAELFLNGVSLGKRTKGPAPQRPTNLVSPAGLASSGDSEQNPADAAIDSDRSTSWKTAPGVAAGWLQAELTGRASVRSVVIDFPDAAKNYGYSLQVSDDANAWRTAVVKPSSEEPRFGGPNTDVHALDVACRYLRLAFDEPRGGIPAAVAELGVYGEPVESSYYDTMYSYRLRWNGIEYKPGELRAVAYLKGREIGDCVVRTAGPAAALRLSPDRADLASTGDDLCYVLVEAIDKSGNPCPLDASRVRFEVEGPAEIAGVGNGDPLSLAEFQANELDLFHGKGMLILRTLEGRSGPIRIVAKASGLAPAESEVRSSQE